jgi:hypothetical protein
MKFFIILMSLTSYWPWIQSTCPLLKNGMLEVMTSCRSIGCNGKESHWKRCWPNAVATDGTGYVLYKQHASWWKLKRKMPNQRKKTETKRVGGNGTRAGCLPMLRKLRITRQAAQAPELAVIVSVFAQPLHKE